MVALLLYSRTRTTKYCHLYPYEGPTVPAVGLFYAKYISHQFTKLTHYDYPNRSEGIFTRDVSTASYWLIPLPRQHLSETSRPLQKSNLLESSDYHSNNNTFSYICCEPLATFSVKAGEVTQQFPDGETNTIQVEQKADVVEHLGAFVLLSAPKR